jgi:hypothetical protein
MTNVQRCAIASSSYVASYNQTMAILQLGFELHWLDYSSSSKGHRFVPVATDYFTKVD